MPLTISCDALAPDERRHVTIDSWVQTLEEWANEACKLHEGAHSSMRYNNLAGKPVSALEDMRLFAYAEPGDNEGYYVYLVAHSRLTGGKGRHGGDMIPLLSVKYLSNFPAAALLAAELNLGIHKSRS